jgi:hypothetical protein
LHAVCKVCSCVQSLLLYGTVRASLTHNVNVLLCVCCIQRGEFDLMADERAAILQHQQQQQQQHAANSSGQHTNVSSFMTSSKRPSVFGAISCKDNVCITVTDTLPSGPGNASCNVYMCTVCMYSVDYLSSSVEITQAVAASLMWLIVPDVLSMHSIACILCN